MSHAAYNIQWNDAQNDIGDLLDIEIPTEPAKPEHDRIAVFQRLAVMYIKYIQIFRKLEECYDQIVHPQKRLVLRRVVDATIGRILELKNNMVQLELSEYHYFDDVLSDLKLTPNDIEIPIPKYFILDNKQVFDEREKQMKVVLQKTRPLEFETKVKEEAELTKEEAVRLIQINERARQGRLRAKFMKEIRMQEERERLAATRGAPTMDQATAVILIQKMWKGFVTRKKTARMREEELVFIGMKATEEKNFQDDVELQRDRRRAVQQENEREYQNALVTIKEKLKDVEGPEMRESMQDQIRQWFIESRDATGKFPEYPTEEEGGSALIFREKDPAELEEELRKKEEEKAKGSAKGKKGKKGKDKEKKEKKGKKGKDKKR